MPIYIDNNLRSDHEEVSEANSQNDVEASTQGEQNAGDRENINDTAGSSNSIQNDNVSLDGKSYYHI